MAFSKPNPDLFPQMFVRAFEKHMKEWSVNQVEQFKKDLEGRIKVEAEHAVAGIALTLAKHMQMNSVSEVLTIDLKSLNLHE